MKYTDAFGDPPVIGHDYAHVYNNNGHVHVFKGTLINVTDKGLGVLKVNWVGEAFYSDPIREADFNSSKLRKGKMNTLIKL